MIQEITCKTAIDYEYPPDGGSVPVVDAYDGCQLRCAYCFQWENQPWNKDLLVKTNLPEVLTRELETWEPTTTLFVGSRSDPYMPLEARYRLTRQILQVAHARGVPCYISTKSDAPAFFDDLPLFCEYRDKLTIGLGQANLRHLRTRPDPRSLPNLRTARRLAELGIPTQVFITPVLPGITDVPAMIGALPEDMPVRLDKLRLTAGSVGEKKLFRYLRRYYPELQARYRALVDTGTDPYYEQLRARYQAEPRVQFVFGLS